MRASVSVRWPCGSAKRWYKAQAAAGAAPAGEAPTGGPGTGANGERVVDAEFEEIDDKKKSA